jgi:hypothetical protein
VTPKAQRTKVKILSCIRIKNLSHQRAEEIKRQPAEGREYHNLLIGLLSRMWKELL